MNKKLLKKTSLNYNGSLSINTLFLSLLFALVSLVGQAQIGPYARFESFIALGGNPSTSTASPNFTTLSAATVNFGSNAAIARSGVIFCQTVANGGWLKTPSIPYAKTFSFYIKTSAAATGAFTFLVEYSTDGFTTPININTVLGYTLPASLTTSYQLVSVTLPSNSYPSVQFRITDTTTRGGGVAGQIIIDDISWDTYTSTGAISTGYPENTVVAPVQTGNGAPVNCAGGTINVGHTDVYNFYDNGGASDQYNINQTNTVTFKPSTAGDNVRVQFISYTGAATEKIEIWDNNGAGTLANNLLTYTSTTIPAVTTYISSIASDGSVTVRFTSDAATNAAGFNIKVDCTQCPKPSSLSSSSVSGTTANLNWGATTAGNYDVYYGTVSSLVLPLVGTTTTTATNSLSLSSLTPGTTYYVWVRSNCGANSYSSWYGPINFTTLSCGAFLLGSSPSTSNQSLCLNSASTPLTASATGGTVSTYQWYSNSSASTVGATAVGTNSSSYTPLTTVAGTLYYYCVITSSTGCTVTTGFSGGITVSALPVVTTSAASVCLGSTINVTPTSGGTWSSSDITIATVTNAGVVTGVASGSVTLTFTSSTAPNCSNTISITVNALPAVSAAAAVCIGSTIIIAPTSGGTWSSSDASKASVSNVGIVTGIAAGSASFTFVNTSTNCSNTTNSVTVNALPVVSTPTTSMCVGSTITLLPTTGGTWTSSDNTIATVNNAGVVTGVAAGSATFTFLNTTTNCSATTSAITINALPVVTAGASVCIGSTITLSPTTGGTWISSSNSIATVTNLGIVTGVAVGNATFTFTNTTTSCSNTTTSVGINALPTITGTLSACTGNTTQLTGSGTAAITNPWVSSNTAVATVNSTGLVTGVTAGSTTITYTTSNGCAITASVTITGIASPVAIAGSSATTTSIVANWNSVSGATGYFLDVSTSNTFASFVAGYNNLSVGNVTTYSVTGLTIGTTYYYRIRATNSCGTSVSSNTIAYATLSSSYCTSTSTSSTAYLSNFDTTGGLTNISNNSSGYSASGYGNFTATQIVTQIQNGVVSFTTSISGIAGGVGISIFVDWNQNGIFTDAGEMVYTTAGYVYSNPSGSFTVPATALSGSTRMRVVVNYFSSSPVSCNSGITGETEDYTFVVTSLACSGNPSSIAAVIVSTTASNISWTAATPSPANGYDYYLSTSAIAPSYGTTPTGSTGAGVTSISLTGLTTSTTYYIWVRANCGGGLGQGAWIGAISFFQPNCAVGNGNGTTTLGCPSVIAGGLGLNGAPPPPITGCSGSGCASLEATYLAMGQTTSYTVQSIPYAPPYQFTCLQNPVSANVDDVWSPMINLPFNFCFYGNNYNKCLISSNGVITFDTVNNSPGGYSEWSYNSNLPSTSLFLSSIFGVYHDIDPSKGGQIGWELITLNTGCRALVASWSDVPMFSTVCNSILYTGMIVLYENTNIIDVYIKNKSVCSTWNDGNATVGIQDSTGTQAAVAPNRNGLDPNWTVTNEAWRFMPSGTSIASVKWYQGPDTTGAVVGTTAVISVCPPTTTSYTAEVSYAMCSGTILKEVSTTTVTVSGSKVWNGSIDSDWNKPNNWTPIGIPNATDCVIIPITANNPIVSQIIIGTPYTALAGTLSVLNGATLTITSVNTITVTDWVKVEPTGNFIIEDSSSLIQVTNVANNVNIGNITYKRNASIRKLDYVYWSSPVAGFNVSNIATPLSAGAIYRWNTTVANSNGGWGNWEAANGDTMIPAKGYIVSAPNSFSSTVNTTLNGLFNGVPNNGVISIPIYRGIDQNTAYHAGNNGIQITNFSDNWNLLGNPYPSSIRGSQFLLDNNTKLEGQIRLWTHGTLPALIPSPFYGTYMYNYTPQDYYTYNFTGTTCCPTADVDLFIGAGQGFFVTMIDGAAGSDTVTFNNTLRNNTYNNTIFYKSGNSTVNSSNNNVNNLERNRIWLDIIDPNNKTDRTLVGYVEGATMSKDSFFDAGTITTGILAIYSLIDKEKYCIQGRSLPFNPNDIVPIGVSVSVPGNYTIAIGAVDGLFENVSREIYLEDTLTGSIQNLRQGPYVVNLLAGTFSDRFKLRYKYPRGHGNDKNTNSLIGDDVIASSSNGQLIVKSSYENIQEITIYDTLGRQLLEVNNIGNKGFISSNISTSQQTLIVKIKLEDGTFVERKVVM